MKKKIIFTLLTLTVAVALLAGGTMSWFTDEDDAGDATFTAGILDIDVSDALEGIDYELQPLDHMNPGDVYNPIEINIVNEGTKNLAWFGDWTFTPGTVDADKLLEALYIKSAKMEFLTPDGTWLTADEFIKDGRGADEGDGYYNTLADKSSFKVVTLKNWNDNGGMAPGTVYEHMGALIPENSYRLTVTLGFHPEAGDEYQGNADGVSPITIGFNVKAFQVNKDALEDAGGALLSNHFGWLKDQIAAQGGSVFMQPTT